MGPTNIQIAGVKNMRLKVEDLQSKLGNVAAGPLTESSEEDSEEDDKPVKNVGKKQRAGVSAEVYGDHNKKADFVPKVVPKSEEIKEKLRKRLLQAFMFNALDKPELDIVVDAIEEVKVPSGENVISEGDAGDCMYVLE